MIPTRALVVVADDYGIGPEISRGILDLMRLGAVCGTVLLVNSPYAEEDIRRWKQSGRIGEMGWHPNLNLDRPVAKANRVTSLLSADGSFASLGTMLFRMAVGRIDYQELIVELEAQLDRFCEMVGHPPGLINGHKHIHAFPIVSRALREVLQRRNLRPYMRRVGEPARCLRSIRGARIKRTFLSLLGRAAAQRQDAAGFRGNNWLAGITDPKWVEDPDFFSRWLSNVPGNIVELAVHPGYRDPTLIGRDCNATDGQLERRVAEQRLLSHNDFRKACHKAGFTLCSAEQIGAVSHCAAA